jgi:spermidine/putrescine transport system permease protein
MKPTGRKLPAGGAKQPAPGRGLAWPPLLYLLVFFLVPLVMVASYSFHERDVYGGVLPDYSSEAWRLALDQHTMDVLRRSLTLSLGVTLACLALGYPCALALAHLPGHWKQVCAVLLTFPLITSLLLRIYGWMNLLPVEMRGTPWSVGLVMTVNYLPFMVLPLLRAIERIDPSLPQAAMDLGATPWRTFWTVSWPLTRPGMWAGSALVFIPVTGEYLVPHFIGAGKVNVLGELIMRQFFEGRNWPYGAAAALWLLGLVLLPAVLASFRRGPTEEVRQP